jgi:uncharacterized surface protein with fasciclin (FAS1) repeats
MNMLRRIALTLAAVAFVTAPAAAGNYGTADKAAARKADKPKMNIVQTAKAAGSFTTLLAAVKAADLQGTLSGQGPYTVFAPTDEAFAKLPAGTVDALLKDPAKLKAILLYHVVAGEVTAAQVVGLTEAQTVEGSSIAIDATDGVVLNGSSKVTKTDIFARNGVIHVIDTVLLPPTD